MPTKLFGDKFLIPSYVMHRGKLSCNFRLCYHAAIRVGPEWTGEIIWSSNSCFGKKRRDAVSQSEAELILARKNRAWPVHWKYPPGGDRNFLHIYPRTEKQIAEGLLAQVDVRKIITNRVLKSRADKVSVDSFLKEYAKKNNRPFEDDVRKDELPQIPAEFMPKPEPPDPGMDPATLFGEEKSDPDKEKP